MTAYYNEFDPKAAAWLRELIEMNMIAPGEVDERSITDVPASDLRGYTQHHFFAGIGVWSFALRNSAWPDSRPVCTASLPCQPFSAAGKQLGKADERHLLPHFLNLVRECGFNTIFGEQVESAIRHGWLDDLQANMEAEGYAIGHAVLGAHSAGSFHQRQRLYWGAKKSMANTNVGRFSGQGEVARSSNSAADKDWQEHRAINDSPRSSMGSAEHNGQSASEVARSDTATVCNSETGTDCTSESKGAGSSGIISGESIEWLYCRDGKYRAIKSGLKPLVDGSARGVVYSGDESQPIDANYTAEARVMRLKGYGNAIHAGTAEMFIRAFMEVS